MKRASAIILILLAISICGYSQDTLSKSKPSQYAIVYIENYTDGYKTLAEYSDGTEENLSKNYDVGYNEHLNLHTYELRLLDYFDKKDYELVSVVSVTPYGGVEKYYFKHK